MWGEKKSLGLWYSFSETAATDRSLHDRGANKLCSHHTCRLGGHGPGIGISKFYVLFSEYSESQIKHFQLTNIYTLMFVGGPCSGPDEI